MYSRNMYTKNDIITEERINSLREIRNKKREKDFEALIPAMGKAAVDEIRKIYEMFDHRMLIWLAGLWEPEIGGFYYSNSARDHEGFLPDLESTNQAIGFITRQCRLCLGEENGEMPITKLPERFASKICSFAYGLQDEDGYFYHPQWGKDVPETRKGRDHMAAWRLIEPLGVECKYLRPTQRPKTGEKKVSLPEHFSSPEAFAAWLDTKELEGHSYQFGHYINSTTGYLFSAGKEYIDILVNWLNEHQNPENGLWESKVTYDAVSGLMKLGLCYPDFGAALPYPEKSFESAMAAVLSDQPVTFGCEFYNAWAAMNASIKSMEFAEDFVLADKCRKRLFEMAPELIRVTGEKMAKCRVSDGSFAYFTEESGKTCPKSQGVPVGLADVREGDINGNGCSTQAPLKHMFSAFGVSNPPFFCEEDAEFLFELMDARVTAPKKAVAER
ncbi:MAG: hypothetical protein J6B48_02545 [Clostridia bacterium]|nr:hypothetical protein [Clostridia bacterium]